MNEYENVLKSNKTSENSVYPFWYICDGCGYRNRGKTVNSEVEFLRSVLKTFIISCQFQALSYFNFKLYIFSAM